MGWANQVSKYGWREHLALSNSQNVIILCKSNSYFHMCPLSSVQSPLAQLVERETVNLEASGSTPLRRGDESYGVKNASIALTCFCCSQFSFDLPCCEHRAHWFSLQQSIVRLHFFTFLLFTPILIIIIFIHC